MNTKAKGSAFERLVVNSYREQGYFAMRAPASLGIDVVVYREGTLYGLECTTEQCMRQQKALKLISACEKWRIVPVYCIKTPGKLGFRTISNAEMRAKLQKRL